MRRGITGALVVVAAAAAAFSLTGAAAPGPAPLARTATALAAGHPAGGPGATLWARRYTTAGKKFDVGRSVAISPRGDKVFVTGYSEAKHTVMLKFVDYATVAYDAATGARLWLSRYNGPANRADEAQSVAVSPSGRTVFVTGYSMGTGTEQDYATIAYDAATGARLWVSRYDGTGHSYDSAAAVTVSPTGRTVFVTGLSAGARSGFDYVTVGYDARTGAQQWARRYNGPGNGFDEARGIATGRHGSVVFVTGSSEGAHSASDYATVAYSARTGAQLWVRRYNGPGNDIDEASSLAVSPRGGQVFVTGDSAGTGSLDYATIAYSAAGDRMWVRRYDGPAGNLDAASSLAVSLRGGQVFVTGGSIGTGSYFDYATIAYRARTGDRMWVRRYNGPADGLDAARSAAVSPDGRTVFVTGGSDGVSSGRDYATIAYDAATGRPDWVRRYDGTGSGWDFAFSIAASRRAVVVTGESVGRTTHYDYATIAYRG